MKKNGALRNLHLATLFMPQASTVHPAARSCFLTLCSVCFNFCFFPYYPCNSFWFWFFFLVISYTMSTYISLSLYKLSITFAIYFWGEAFSSPVFFLYCSLFFHFLFYFLGSQTPSEDDNSEDERLKPFLP